MTKNILLFYTFMYKSNLLYDEMCYNILVNINTLKRKKKYKGYEKIKYY